MGLSRQLPERRMDDYKWTPMTLTQVKPLLFTDYDTFYNAFIAGGGRSPEAEKSKRLL